MKSKLKKKHILIEVENPSDYGTTYCRKVGRLRVGDEGVTQLATADGMLTIVDVLTDATCISCVRIIVGAPRKKLKPKYFHSKHLRRSVRPLGLLKG
jgi:hypothetical protein